MQYTNKELYARCLELSGMIKTYRNQFIALLPEVQRRRLFLEYGMHSVYEFAAKLAGLSHNTVRRVLKLESELADKPVLKKLFAQGAIGWSKIEVATKIVDNLGHEKVERILPSLSVSALRTLARDLKNDVVGLPSQNDKMCFELTGELSGSFDEKVECTKSDFLENFTVKLRPHTLAQLRVLKQQLEKQSGYPLTWEQAMSSMIAKLQNPDSTQKALKRVENSIPVETAKIAVEPGKAIAAKAVRNAQSAMQVKVKPGKAIVAKAVRNAQSAMQVKVKPASNTITLFKATSQVKGTIDFKSVQSARATKSVRTTNRYIPRELKREALQKTKNLCAKCHKPAENFHHQIPFAISRNHDSIIPLCKNHHIIEHHKEDSYINRKFQRCRS
jgi:hypothetical protein